MKTVNKDDINTAYRFIKTNCVDLHASLFEHHFFEGPVENVFKNLKKYQNDDGGFGNGLEPDFLLPDSSAMATTIAFQIMNKLGGKDEGMVSAAIKYLESNYDPKRNGWWAVPAQINHHPHAPWWNYDPEQNQTVIDNHWGNPSSEIIGILFENRNSLQRLDIDPLLEHAISYLNSITEYESEHEIFCYIRMFDKLPERYQQRLMKPISIAIQDLVCLDMDKWNTYVPKPLDFIQSKQHPLFSVIEEYAEKNCDYLVDTVKDSIWHPTWEWHQYAQHWEQSRKNWIAVLTLKNYLTLREFNRIR